MNSRAPALNIGSRLGEELTVVGAIDTTGREPVYLVWHHGSWCPMACKIFTRPEKAEREAATLSAVAHPNVVRCLGVNPPNCVLMEFLEGPTLHTLAGSRGRRRLSINDGLRVAIHIGAALNHIHRCGLIHMDVKPSNVVVSHGRPVLFDFGIAREQGAVRPEVVTGTDPYISPEECLLNSVTPAVDVFGLGVTLYELLTGHMPWPEGTKDAPYPQIDGLPTPLRVYRPAVSRALEASVMSCLHRDPRARPSLRTLLPQLHDSVRRGPRMWPPGFRPDYSD